MKKVQSQHPKILLRIEQEDKWAKDELPQQTQLPWKREKTSITPHNQRNPKNHNQEQEERMLKDVDLRDENVASALKLFKSTKEYQPYIRTTQQN